MKCTILYCHTSRLGGAEIAAPRLAKALGARMWVRGTGLSDRAKDLGVGLEELRAVQDTRPRSVLGIFSALLSLARVQFEMWRRLKACMPDRLICNSIQGLVHVALPAALCRVPVLCYVRDLGRGGNRPIVEVWLYERLIRHFARGAIFNSQLTASSWSVGVPSVVVYTPIDDGYFVEVGKHLLREPHVPFRIVIVGRIAPWKGQAQLVRSINLLVESGYHLSLTVMGASTFDEELGLPECLAPLEMLGFVDPLELLGSFDLLVHASISPEPFGQVLAQAAAAGLPIVCSKRGGHTEWLRHGENCLEADPQDIRDLADAIALVVDNYADAVNRAKAARSAAEMFRTGPSYFRLERWIKENAC